MDLSPVEVPMVRRETSGLVEEVPRQNGLAPPEGELTSELMGWMARTIEEAVVRASRKAPIEQIPPAPPARPAVGTK